MMHVAVAGGGVADVDRPLVQRLGVRSPTIQKHQTKLPYVRRHKRIFWHYWQQHHSCYSTIQHEISRHDSLQTDWMRLTYHGWQKSRQNITQQTDKVETQFLLRSLPPSFLTQASAEGSRVRPAWCSPERRPGEGIPSKQSRTPPHLTPLPPPLKLTNAFVSDA